MVYTSMYKSVFIFFTNRELTVNGLPVISTDLGGGSIFNVEI